MASYNEKKKYKLLIEGRVFYKKININKNNEVFDSIKTSDLVLIKDYDSDSESDISDMILINDYGENRDYRPKSSCCCF